MFGLGRQRRFDPDTLSSIWVMACRDDSPVVTAYSAAYRLGDVTPDEVMELVRGRREMFRLGLTGAQSRAWKDRYREGREGGEDGEKPERAAPPDWIRVFDEEGPEADQRRVKAWLGDGAIASSKQALDRFLDKGFVIDEQVFRSQFRADHELRAEPSDLQTVNWGLEHIDRLRRGRAETRQHLIALTTGIGGVAIGALVALTAPVVTTIYQGRPLDTARFTIDHQQLVNGYGALGTAVAEARRAARAGDGEALAASLGPITTAATTLRLLLDEEARGTLRDRQARALDACGATRRPPDREAPAPGCAAALDELQRLLDGPLAEGVLRRG